MQESLITFKTANLAKERGFPQNFSYAQFINMGNDEWKFYNKEDADNLDDSIGIGKNIRCSCPTQALLQKWLREVHKIIVEITWQMCSTGYEYAVINMNNPPKYEDDIERIIGFKTYEEALEVGLQEGLKLIKV